MDIEQINIAQLSNLLRRRESDILEGRNKLSLTASLLQKINYSLQELEYDRVHFPSSRAEDPKKYLQDLIQKTPKLTVTQKIRRETWRVDISRFTSLKYLELNRIPMHLVEGMQGLRPQLKVLICERCTDCLETILGAPDEVWQQLETAKLCYNGFAQLNPLSNTPFLQYLDLSYNKIEDRLSLQTLKNLKYLNLSFNFLTSVPMLSDEVSHQLKVLLVNNNYIQDLAAISVMEGLEVLNASHNLLADHSAISPILFLPRLRSLDLSSNPISHHPLHRFHTCSYLHLAISASAHKFLLDNRPLNEMERQEIGRRGETFRHLGISLPTPDLTCLPGSSQPLIRTVITKSSSKRKVRDVVIEEGTSNEEPMQFVKSAESQQRGIWGAHLETKRQVEELRERVGGEHWLHSQAGSFVQDLLGLPVTPMPHATSTPLPHMDSFITNAFDSSTSDEYVSAMTTQAIVERLPTEDESTEERQTEETERVEETVEIPEEGTKTEGNQEEDVADKEQAVANEKEEEEEEEEEQDIHLWLVQKHTDNGLLEIFLTLSENEVRERNPMSGRVTTRWSRRRVESCEQTNAKPVTVRIDFATVKRADKSRTYDLEPEDAKEVIAELRTCVESQPLSAVPFRCLRCSVVFCHEMRTSVLSSQGCSGAQCPSCGSRLAVMTDDVPLPSNSADSDASTPTQATHVPALSHSPSDCSIGSAASLDVEEGRGGEQPPTSRHDDSEIEVISNPSLSSIEVLEVQARLQAGSQTASKKRSNEERPTAPLLNPVPETQNGGASVALTESSSSGSLTDSVCTAYESAPVPSRKGTMSDVPEEPSGTTYASLLQGLMQRIAPQQAREASPTPTTTRTSMDNSLYHCSDFSRIDHRVQLYLHQHVFTDGDEQLFLLLRGDIVAGSGELGPGCLVVSTHSVYVLHVVASETGDDPSHWFTVGSRYTRSELRGLSALPWDLGAAFHFTSSSRVLVLVSDPSTVRALFRYVNASRTDAGNGVVVIDEDRLPVESAVSFLLASSAPASDGPVDASVRHCALTRTATVTKDRECELRVPCAPLVLTASDVVLLRPQFSWLLSDLSPSALAWQKVANIVDIGVSGASLRLQFLNEHEGSTEDWLTELATAEARDRIVDCVRDPWEQLFSIPLTLTRHL